MNNAWTEPEKYSGGSVCMVMDDACTVAMCVCEFFRRRSWKGKTEQGKIKRTRRNKQTKKGNPRRPIDPQIKSTKGRNPPSPKKIVHVSLLSTIESPITLQSPHLFPMVFRIDHHLHHSIITQVS